MMSILTSASPAISRVNRSVSKRQFLGCLGGVASCAMLPLASVSALQQPHQRALSFHHLHTGERLTSTYWNGTAYEEQELNMVNTLLRDFRTGEVHPIEHRLLDILHTVQVELSVEAPYQVIGGFRSTATNAMLRKRSNGVAKKSLHMEGRAIDVRIQGVDSKLLREVAADLRLGGVGYYRRSNFVHLDTGRPRVW